nr:DCC1-like thiol-disulfide oxidoreductase family protein [Novosphingobium sp. CF614]
MTDDHPIILFDAECVLCSANAQFILTHDRDRRFRLASMQGKTGSALFCRHGIDPTDPDTILVIEGESVLRDSDAVISIYTGLGWPWRAWRASFLDRYGTRCIVGSRGTATASSASATPAGYQIHSMLIGCYDAVRAILWAFIQPPEPKRSRRDTVLRQSVA